MPEVGTQPAVMTGEGILRRKDGTVIRLELRGELVDRKPQEAAQSDKPKGGNDNGDFSLNNRS